MNRPSTVINSLLLLCWLLVGAGRLYSNPLGSDPLDRDQSTVETNSLIERYSPSNRPAADLIHTLQPLFESDSLFTTDGRTILIKAPQPSLAEILELLPALDHPIRQLLVEISSAPSTETDGRYATQPRGNHQYIIQEGETLRLSSETASSDLTIWQRIDQDQRLLVARTELPNERKASGGEATMLTLTINTTLNRAYISLERSEANNGHQRQLQQTRSGRLNEWLQFGEATAEYHASKAVTVSTVQRHHGLSPLYLRISIVDPLEQSSPH